MRSVPFTEKRLAAEIERRHAEQIRRLLPVLADDPGRAPAAFRAGRTRSEWLNLTTAERIEIAGPAIRARSFDLLVARYGLRLNDGRLIEPTESRV